MPAGSLARPVCEATQRLAAPSVSGEELPAVSVPWPLVRSKLGGSFASFSSDVSAARDRVARAVADRNDQIVEEAAIPRGDGALMALERDRVLLLAADAAIPSR